MSVTEGMTKKTTAETIAETARELQDDSSQEQEYQIPANISNHIQLAYYHQHLQPIYQLVHQPLEFDEENNNNPRPAVIDNPAAAIHYLHHLTVANLAYSTDTDESSSSVQESLPRSADAENPGVPNHTTPSKSNHATPSKSNQATPSAPNHSTPSAPNHSTPSAPNHSTPSTPNHSTPSAPNHSTPNTPNHSTPNTIKQEMIVRKHQDTNYWERRRKNNQSAKRSRDSKKKKDEMAVYHVLKLEEEQRGLLMEKAQLEKQLDGYKKALEQC